MDENTALTAAAPLQATVAAPKETGEVVTMIEDLAKAIAAAKADGHVDWMDLPKFASVVLDARAAVDGGEKIPAEIKAMSGEQAVALAEQVVAAAMQLVAAIITK